MYMSQMVHEGCFKRVSTRVPVRFSPHFLGARERTHLAVSLQLESHLFRYNHQMGGMPIAFTQYHFDSAKQSPLCVDVSPELKGWMSFSVQTDFVVLAPPVGSRVRISLTSLDRKRPRGRCVATVLFLCEVRFEGGLLEPFFRLSGGRWMTKDGKVELCERDVIEVSVVRVSSGEAGIAIALDVDTPGDSMELIKADGTVYSVTKDGATWTRLVRQDGNVVTAPLPSIARAVEGGTGSEVVEANSGGLSITLIIQELYNVRIHVKVNARDALRTLKARIAQECQLSVASFVIHDLVLVRLGSSLRLQDSFERCGIVDGDSILVKSETANY